MKQRWAVIHFDVRTGEPLFVNLQPEDMNSATEAQAMCDALNLTSGAQRYRVACVVWNEVKP